MKTFPPQIKYIIGNEACERFSYYGVVSILTLYLKNILGMDKSEATEVAHLFMTAVYFLPLAGGWLADRYLGRYRTILFLSLFYCLGHGMLALGEGTRAGLYSGLALIAIGAGGIKPCVSAFVGDQFPRQEERVLTKAYGLFYWAINIGAFFGFALIPLIRDKANYRWAFGVPGLFMAAATFIFWLGRRHYRRAEPAPADSPNLLSIWFTALAHRAQRQRGQSFLDGASSRFSRPQIEAAKAVAGILVIFSTIPVFWALFNQVNTTWVLQGEKMVPFQILGFKVDAERIQSAGALLVLIWVPILTLWLYPLAQRLGLNPTPLRRMGAGMVLAGIAFCGCALIQHRIDLGNSVSLAWQLIPYIILEAGEVMLSATALEFAFSQAPPSMKSIIMSFWLMTISLGHFLVAVFTNLNQRWFHAEGAAEFYFYAILMFLVAGVFIVCAVRYRGARTSSSAEAQTP